MIRDIESKVRYILTNYPEARDDDDILVALLYREYHQVDRHSFYDIKINRRILGLPSEESVTRIRRRLQEEAPLLYGASGEARRERAKIRDQYKEEFKHG